MAQKVLNFELKTANHQKRSPIGAHLTLPSLPPSQMNLHDEQLIICHVRGRCYLINKFSIKMNGKITNHPRTTDCLDRFAKTLKTSYFPNQPDQNSKRPRQNGALNDEWRGRAKANLPPSFFETKLPTESICRPQSKVQFRNAEKLKHFEQLKASNIDDLNCKIQRMISKLSDQVSPCSSFVAKDSKARVRTEYSDLADSSNNDSHPALEHFFARGEEMMESEVIKHSQVFQERRVTDNALGHKADAIRKKYKLAPEAGKGRIKHEKSVSALNNSSLFEDAPYPSHHDAELIRFRQRLKVNNERERKELSRQLNFPLNSSTEKPAAKPVGKQKRNIDEEMREYEKRLNKYDSKKLIGLANEGEFERVPLGDRTNSNNSYLKYSPYSSKHKQPTSHFKLKLKREEHFQPHIDDFDQPEEPLTADFRQPSDKNQLKILLKNLQGQITVDEQFRNCKKWFERVGDPSKWEELSEQVRVSRLDLDETAIRQIFTLKEEEENPFYTPRENEYDYQRLVELFIRCEEHWFENVVKKYSEQRLLACGFRESKLDIAGKGFLAIEDLVRFLSLEMDLQVRNRDLLMIFERLRSEDQLRFWQLVEVICQ